MAFEKEAIPVIKDEPFTVKLEFKLVEVPIPKLPKIKFELNELT